MEESCERGGAWPHPSPREAEAGGSLGVRGQFGLQCETTSPYKKQIGRRPGAFQKSGSCFAGARATDLQPSLQRPRRRQTPLPAQFPGEDRDAGSQLPVPPAPPSGRRRGDVAAPDRGHSWRAARGRDRCATETPLAQVSAPPGRRCAFRRRRRLREKQQEPRSGQQKGKEKEKEQRARVRPPGARPTRRRVSMAAGDVSRARRPERRCVGGCVGLRLSPAVITLFRVRLYLGGGIGRAAPVERPGHADAGVGPSLDNFWLAFVFERY